MPEFAIDDWTRFRVGSRSTSKNWTEPSCQQLTSVLHVTHIRHALSVLSEGKVAPQLIYDESRLNTKRILVVWLSPNDWGNAGGFHYGNIGFELEWSQLVAGKRCYWVGAMDYKPPACRILITDQNHDGTLKPYEPGSGDGPWWYDAAANTHYWNGRYCLEFMLEGPVQLDAVASLRFVTHHPVRCSIAPGSCPDRKHDGQRGGARFLAGACAGRILRPFLWLTEEDVPTRQLKSAWNELRYLITRRIDDWRGPVTAGDEAAAALARSVLDSISNWRREDRRDLVALFRSEQDAVDACAEVIEKALGLAVGVLYRSDEDCP